MSLVAFQIPDQEGSVTFAKVLRESTNWIQIQRFGASTNDLRSATILPMYEHKDLSSSSYSICEFPHPELKPVMKILDVEEAENLLMFEEVLLTSDNQISPETKNYAMLVNFQSPKYVRKQSIVERWTATETDILLNNLDTSIDEVVIKLGKGVNRKNKQWVKSKMARLGLCFVPPMTVDRYVNPGSTHGMTLRTRITRPDPIYE